MEQYKRVEGGDDNGGGSDCIAFAVVNIFYKMAANDGMKMTVLIAYRFLFASAFILPLALFLERGAMAQNLYAQSLVLTSATFATAMTNLVPALTFILATSFRLERLGFGTTAGKAKVLGTLICIGGAMLLTLYKGAEIDIFSTNVNLLHKSQPHRGGHVASSHEEGGNHALGALLIVCCCFSAAAGLIVQGIVASGVTCTFMAWVVQMRGPLFVSIFNPLMLVLVAIAGSLLSQEKLHLGSVLGAVVIICGLYMILWGKGKELKRIYQLIPSKNSRELECIEIIATSSTENNNNMINSNIIAIDSDNITLYNIALDGDISKMKNIGEGEERKNSKLDVN
ncbi:WAT1-related protein At1g68170-like [Camellia sinensis]|uniref:WAT1-related protein At1g68170-like n=1 Tax=Camellia sinensis TaxID=4442 RepID=UPI00103667F3|nr:WAT1-related protein At1g68170-like [Camellia sinensis]